VIKQVANKVKLIVVPEMNLGQIVLEVERAARGQTEVRGVNRADGDLVTPQQIMEALEV
jgi:2-oxoglutarate ferredoxin oxidoreductase subunit alpha